MAADNSLLRSHLRELLSELCNKFEQFTNSQDSWPPDHVTVRIAAASLAALGHRPAGMALLTEYNRLTFDLVGHTAAQIIERTPKSRRAAERRQWQQLIGEIPSYDRLPKNVREDRDLIIRGQAARLGVPCYGI